MSDFLPYINCAYTQDKQAYHFNSDTVLLGMFMGNQKGKCVLDVGTAAGALLCYAAKKGAKHLYGIDIDGNALRTAEENLSLLKVPYSLTQTDYKDLSMKEVDSIVINPPFYPSSGSRCLYQYAMDENYLPLKTMFEKSRSLLKSNGSLYVIYPAQRLSELMSRAAENDFSSSEMAFVYDDNKQTAVRVLVKFKRGLKAECRVLKQTLIKDGKIAECPFIIDINR